MDILSGILGIVLLLGTPAVVVGGVTALIVRAATSGRGPAEAGRATLKGFWIAFVITIALELILIGLCFAALNDAYGG